MKPIVERLLPCRRLVLWATHAALAALAYLLAFYIDGEFFIGPSQWTLFLGTLPLLLPIRLATFAWFHLFEGLWRYVSMRDMRNAEWTIEPRAESREVGKERTNVRAYEGTARMRNHPMPNFEFLPGSHEP